MTTTYVSTPQLLQTPYVTRVVSSLLVPQSRIQKEFGILSDPVTGAPGPNIRPIEGQTVKVDLFDATKTVGTARAADQGPQAIAPQIIGQFPATLIRLHEKIPMTDNKLTRVRTLGGQYGELDNRGKSFLMRQQQYMAQRVRNLREFVMGMMLRGGKLYYKQVGDTMQPTATSTGSIITVDFKLPTGQTIAIGGAMANNLTLGTYADIIAAANPWDNAATSIIQDLLEIDAGSEQVSGMPFRHYWCNSATWGKIITNTEVRNTGGSVVAPFGQYDKWIDNAGQRPGFVATLKGHPHIVWHVINETLTDPGTGSAVEMMPSGYIAAHPDINSSWFEFVEGSEIVRENKMDMGSMRTGIAAWVEPTTQPAGQELITLDNFLPILNVPGALAFFRVY